MLNRSLSRLKYANKTRALTQQQDGKFGVCRERGGTLWCGVNHRIAACMVRALARQAVGPLMHVSSSGLVEINVL